MASLQKMISQVQDLDPIELDQVGGGLMVDGGYSADPTTTCYTDSSGNEHCVTNRDPCD